MFIDDIFDVQTRGFRCIREAFLARGLLLSGSAGSDFCNLVS